MLSVRVFAFLVTLSAMMSRPELGLAELDLLDDARALEPVVELEVLLLAVAGDRVVAAPDVELRVAAGRGSAAADCAAAALALPTSFARDAPAPLEPGDLPRRAVDLEVAAVVGLGHVEAGQRQRRLVLGRRRNAVRVERLARGLCRRRERRQARPASRARRLCVYPCVPLQERCQGDAPVLRARSCAAMLHGVASPCRAVRLRPQWTSRHIALRASTAPVATIALDQPETRNALSDALLDELLAALRRGARRRRRPLRRAHLDAREGLLGGGNLAGFAAERAADRTSTSRSARASRALFRAIGELGKPTLCAANGHVLAGRARARARVRPDRRAARACASGRPRSTSASSRS